MSNVPGVRGARKARSGTVVSDKMEKTIVVAVQTNVRHPIYKKTIRRVRKYLAHDEDEQARLGDLVLISEAAPKSKRKRWQLVQIIAKGEVAELTPEAIDSTLIEELTAHADQQAPAAVPEETVASPEGEAAAPAAVAVEGPPAVEIAPVMEDAGPEALEPEAMSEEEAETPVAQVPPIEQEEPVQQDAPPEALEPVERENE
jgi:small subunit ribosomal protein S17